MSKQKPPASEQIPPASEQIDNYLSTLLAQICSDTSPKSCYSSILPHFINSDYESRRGFRIYEVGKNNLSQVTELLKEVSKLDALDRAELIASLLEELDPSPHYVSDEEALQRLHDLRSGRVKGLSEDELRVLG